MLKKYCVNCVSPGFIKTEMTDKINEEFKNTIGKIPSGVVQASTYQTV